AKKPTLFFVVNFFSNILISPSDPPVLNMNAAPFPSKAVITRKRAFQGSIITSSIHVNVIPTAVNGSPPAAITPPTHILIYHENTTRFVIIAKATATIGGITDKKPMNFSLPFILFPGHTRAGFVPSNLIRLHLQCYSSILLLPSQLFHPFPVCRAKQLHHLQKHPECQ